MARPGHKYSEKESNIVTTMFCDEFRQLVFRDVDRDRILPHHSVVLKLPDKDYVDFIQTKYKVSMFKKAADSLTRIEKADKYGLAMVAVIKSGFLRSLLRIRLDRYEACMEIPGRKSGGEFFFADDIKSLALQLYGVIENVD